MKDGSVKVVDMDRLVDNFVAEIVGGSVGDASLNTSSC